MSIPHFYLENQVVASEEAEAFPLRLSPGDVKHARALRLAPGEHMAVIDAAGDYFECEIVAFSDAIPLVRIAQHGRDVPERPSIVLVQGLAKGDKMDTVVRHATELGVGAIVPLACERAVVRLDAKKAQAKTERWRAVAKSAAMQSGQPRLAEVTLPQSVEQAASLVAQAHAVLVCWEEAPQSAFLDDALERALDAQCMPARDARVAVVVGPEGGLAPCEVDAFLSCSDYASLVTLGPSILRTETAGIVAPALIMHALERVAREQGGAIGRRCA